MADETKTIDAKRGIQNPKATFVSEDRQTVREQYKKEKSIGSRARRFDSQVSKLEEDMEIAARGGALIEEEERQERVAFQERLRAGAKVLKKKKPAVPKTARTMAGFAKWGGYYYVGMAWMFQLAFAVISSIAFMMHVSVLQFKNETVVGQFIGFFIDFDQYIPTLALGMGFWVLSTLLVISVFFPYGVLYTLQGVNPFGTVTRFLVTSTCFAFSYLPVINIFPWYIVWMAYMNTVSLFSFR